MCEIAVRVAVPADVDVLTSLLTASYKMLLAHGPYDPQMLARALPVMSQANPRLLASGTYFVAETDGAPAGCGGWTFDGPGTGQIEHGVAHIRHFATHPAHLRKGIARRLVERCLSEAAAAGARIMKCQSTLPAESFYASSGFRRVGLVTVTLGPGILLPAVDMQRGLP